MQTLNIGHNTLGGIELDFALFELLAREVQQVMKIDLMQPEHARKKRDFLAKCKEVKEDLSTNTEVRHIIYIILRG